MALNIQQQRLDRLKVRTEELKYWRAREGVTVDRRWECIDGKPIAKSAAPGRAAIGRQQIDAASAEVPAHWPPGGDAACSLDLGGESLVTLSYPNRDSVSFGIDPYHRRIRRSGTGRSRSAPKAPRASSFGASVRSSPQPGAGGAAVDRPAGAPALSAAEAGLRSGPDAGQPRCRAASGRGGRILPAQPRLAVGDAGLHRPHGALAAAASRSGNCRRCVDAADRGARSTRSAEVRRRRLRRTARSDAPKAIAAAEISRRRASCCSPATRRISISGVAVALCRDAAQGAPHLPHRARA